MSLKKLLGIISVVIIVVFSMMLTTSYAWYAFDNASTVFEGMTSLDDIIITYHHGEYINTDIAIPITSDQVDKYSEKNNFSIDVKNSAINDEMIVTISLVDISIDRNLQNSNFKVGLYHQSSQVSLIAGNTIGVSNATTKTLGTVTLDNDVTNNFELRIYILDNNGNQSAMMGKTFQAKIKVDVVSRLKAKFKDYDNPDILISSITIDGEASSYLPTSGYYEMSSSCEKAGDNILNWDPLAKTITYPSASPINDSCSLEFVTSYDYPLLSEMETGSYVKYVGSNGCDGKACEGQNAHYKSDTDMGYCSSSNYKFYVNGWRIGYIENGSVHLVSAGAPECVKTFGDGGVASEPEILDVGENEFFYGSGYTYDRDTGLYTLTGTTDTALSWVDNYESIIANTPYTCYGYEDDNMSCSFMYKIVDYFDSRGGGAYEYNNYDVSDGALYHMLNLNNKALKYCNDGYIKGGVCDNSTTWAMNKADFLEMTGGNSICYDGSADLGCGYTNDLVDVGGFYWLAETTSATQPYVLAWVPGVRGITDYLSYYQYGLRPVLSLNPTVYVVGGSGTYDDPYQIANNYFTINDDDGLIESDELSDVSLSLRGGSDVSTMCISVNDEECTNYVEFRDSYILDWSSETAGEKIVYVYYKNSEGKIIAKMQNSIMVKLEDDNLRNVCDDYNTLTECVNNNDVTLLGLWDSGLDKDGYRYVGTNPDNYICFGTTDLDTCLGTPGLYLFRIIGIFNDTPSDDSGGWHLKLIRKEALNSEVAWDSDTYGDNQWTATSLKSGLNGSYYLNNTSSSFLQDTTWKGKIMSWKYTTVNTDYTNSTGLNYNLNTVKTVYLHELNRSKSGLTCYHSSVTTTCSTGKWGSVTTKIGVMYASDYLLSLGSKSLSYKPTSKYSTLKTGWLHLSKNDSGAPQSIEWTIAREGMDSYDQNNAWTIKSNGSIGVGVVNKKYSVRPVFYLTSDTKLISGSGLATDPYMIEY